jgi:hypothetical protein
MQPRGHHQKGKETCGSMLDNGGDGTGAERQEYRLILDYFDPADTGPHITSSFYYKPLGISSQGPLWIYQHSRRTGIMLTEFCRNSAGTSHGTTLTSTEKQTEY